MAEMKRFGEAETSRRHQLESALQKATSLFKRELAAKDGELADVHAELGCDISTLPPANSDIVEANSRSAPLLSPHIAHWEACFRL